MSTNPAARGAPPAAGEGRADEERLLERIGMLTRAVHEGLRDLRVEALIGRAAEAIPDARDRLAYVSRMTEQAAGRVLNAADVAGPLQDGVRSGAERMQAEWRALLAAPAGGEELRGLGERTLVYLSEVCVATTGTKAQLTEIVLAQEFQDLTGQVLEKLSQLVRGMEEQLMELLADYGKLPAAADAGHGGLHGPQVAVRPRADVMAGQDQVDDLLASLGL
ncbi:MAG TPA: protein phosphatase CheZ [Burkholderiales bacterium]|nr:protein phosphatase CheZ [Burkholderiales bacterium]